MRASDKRKKKLFHRVVIEKKQCKYMTVQLDI